MPRERWTIRDVERTPSGTALAFVTRTCCGPDGEGECLSMAEGLACGVAMVPTYPRSERAEALRQLRVDLGLSLRAAAAGLGLQPVDLGAIERSVRDVEEWDELVEALRELAS